MGPGAASPRAMDPFCVLRPPHFSALLSFVFCYRKPAPRGTRWEASGIGGFAVLPIALCGVVLVVLAPAIDHVRRPGEAEV